MSTPSQLAHNVYHIPTSTQYLPPPKLAHNVYPISTSTQCSTLQFSGYLPLYFPLATKPAKVSYVLLCNRCCWLLLDNDPPSPSKPLCLFYYFLELFSDDLSLEFCWNVCEKCVNITFQKHMLCSGEEMDIGFVLILFLIVF